MAGDSKKLQPIIIKRIKKGGHAAHGGAWKIAYADFVTAMMAQLARSARREPFPIAAPAVPSTLLLADKGFCVPEPVAARLRSAGWDIRVKPGAVHDLHLQDPRGCIAMLDDVLRAR